MVLTTLAALVASYAYVVVVPPRYVGVAKVLLEEPDRQFGQTRSGARRRTSRGD